MSPPLTTQLRTVHLLLPLSHTAPRGARIFHLVGVLVIFATPVPWVWLANRVSPFAYQRRGSCRRVAKRPNQAAPSAACRALEFAFLFATGYAICHRLSRSSRQLPTSAFPAKTTFLSVPRLRKKAVSLFEKGHSLISDLVYGVTN